MTTHDGITKRGAGGIGIGWLLAITLGGGALLFTAVGIVLVWRVKSKRKTYTSASYRLASPVATMTKLLTGSSTTRLTKRRLLDSESHMGLGRRTSSPWSSGATLALPPLPPYNGFHLFGNRPRRGKRRRWCGLGRKEEEEERETMWFGRDSWLGRVPTLPRLNRWGTFSVGRDGEDDQGEEGAVEMELGDKEQLEGYQSSAPALHGYNSTHGPQQVHLQQQQHHRYAPHQQYQQYRQQQQDAEEPQQPAHPLIRFGHRRGHSDGQIIVVQKRQSRNMQAAQDAAASADDDALRGRTSEVSGRAAGQMYVRPSVTDSDLKHILISTERRLRENSRSLAGTPQPQASPTRATPTRTPRSGRSGRSGRDTPGSQHRGTPTRSKMSRNASASSLDNASHNLIREAMEQLVHPGGSASPSRSSPARSTPGQEWRGDNQTPQQTPTRTPRRHQQQSGGSGQRNMLPSPQGPRRQTPDQSPRRSPQRSTPRAGPSPQRRRHSWESDVSSSLSTLYSVGDSDEKRAEMEAGQDGDPFVTRALRHSRSFDDARPAGPRPLGRDNIISSPRLSGSYVSSAVPSPLQPLAAGSPELNRRNSERYSLRHSRPEVLEPPRHRAHGHGRGDDDDVAPKTPRGQGQRVQLVQQDEALSKTPSLTSMVTESDTDEEPGGTAAGEAEAAVSAESTPRATPGRPAEHRSWSPPVSPLTPTTAKCDDLSSSPFNEHEILSLLLSPAAPRRALPRPPTAGPDGTVVPSPLSARPKHATTGMLTPMMPSRSRNVSGSSSVYCDEEPRAASPAASVGTAPSRSASRRSVRTDRTTMTGSIAELRRMNSMVSSYSAVSLASTAAPEPDLSTLPPLPDGYGRGTTPTRSGRKPKSIGSKHYLNIDQKSPKRGTKSRSAPPPNTSPAAKHAAAKQQHRHGLGLVAVDTQRRAEALASSMSAAAVEQRERARKSRKPRAVEELVAQEKRRFVHSSSAESLYDKDGFLLSSPDREAERRSFRV